MKYDGSPACKTCPYRQSSKPGHWAPEEFVNVVDSEFFPTGSVFGCHCEPRRFSDEELAQFKDKKKLPDNTKVCVGWLVDQIRRGLPSKALHQDLALFGIRTDPEAVLRRTYGKSLQDLDLLSLQQTLERNVPEEAARFARYEKVRLYRGVDWGLSEDQVLEEVEQWRKLLRQVDEERLVAITRFLKRK